MLFKISMRLHLYMVLASFRPSGHGINLLLTKDRDIRNMPVVTLQESVIEESPLSTKPLKINNKLQ
jgi:hypothetical protein